jgi:putative ABC transport system ATP-binding protein
MADRIITVKSGTVESMRLNTEIVDVENIEW